MPVGRTVHHFNHLICGEWQRILTFLLKKGSTSSFMGRLGNLTLWVTEILWRGDGRWEKVWRDALSTSSLEYPRQDKGAVWCLAQSLPAPLVVWAQTLPGAGQPRGGSAWRWTGHTRSPSVYSAPASGPWPRRSHPGCPLWAPGPSASAPARCWSSSPAPSGRPGTKFVKMNFQLPSPKSSTYYMKQVCAPNIMYGSPTPTV